MHLNWHLYTIGLLALCNNYMRAHYLCLIALPPPPSPPPLIIVDIYVGPAGAVCKLSVMK